MATVSAASTFAGPAVGMFSAAAPRNLRRAAAGLPRLAAGCKLGGAVRCSTQDQKVTAASRAAAMGAAAAAAWMTTTTTGPAVALVDERMSTEGTGLSLGISNNLLVWILLGVFALIWGLYFAYTSTLDEDDDSALSL